MTRTITALYDSRDDAERARSQLTAAGIEPSAVQITAEDTNAGGAASSTSQSGSGHASGEHRGFLAGIKEFFMPDEDRHAYGEAVRRGSYLLSARVPEGQADHVCQILEDSGAIDFDERQQQWRAEGWSGGVAGYDMGAREAGSRDETIPVVDEQLRVGKREVERGGVRVRSYVEETPVQEQVSLREEHVEIERRPVDETVRAGNADNLFQERSIELTEFAEEAVVAKEAVVREEIGIRKDVDERTETISDTVRHTHVDVEDTRGGRSGTTAGVAGERATFMDRDDDSSLAMDGDHGERIGETEEERRERLERGTDRTSRL
jgi:uncharacterized protein (TIGR02271 family)